MKKKDIDFFEDILKAAANRAVEIAVYNIKKRKMTLGGPTEELVHAMIQMEVDGRLKIEGFPK